MTPPPPPASPSPASPFDPAELAGHVAWVQRLARALVRDAAAAEDVAQETWRVTLAQPPGRVGGGARLRAWLGGVARRLAIDRSRAERSRAVREEASARDATAAAPHEPHEIVERSARQQRVVAAVMQLAEPYRSTVLYRWFDELSTRDVAARMQCSEEAVRKRLERAHAQLRSALDREFGAPTRQWAGLLLAGPGVVAMASKAKAVAVAAGVVLALGAAAWQWRAPSPAVAESPDGARSVVATPEAAVAPPEPALDEAIELPTAQRAAATAAPLDAPLEEAAAVIPVAVADPAGLAFRSGRLRGAWREFPRPGADRTPAPFDEAASGFEPWRSFDVAITGVVTELRLPATAREIRVAASVEGRRPSGRREVDDPASAAAARRGEASRWPTVRLLVGEASPDELLRGRITVDGVARVPLGLAIEPKGKVVGGLGNAVRIDTLAASYEIAPLPSRGATLWVTSDETVPREIELDDGQETQDLDLASGRSLELTVLDRRTGRIAPGVELHFDVGVVTHKSFFRESWRDHARFARSGADGVVRMVGLPEVGSLAVRRDGSMTISDAPLEGTLSGLSGARIATLPEPLLSLRLERDGPRVVQATVRLDFERPTRRLFGTLPPPWLAEGVDGEPAAQLFFAKELAGERPERRDLPIAAQSDGAWSLEVEPGTTILLWAERERRRISAVARVVVGEEDVGPIELVERPGSEVVVRVHGCPSDGFLSFDVDDPGAVTPLGSVTRSRGGTFERRLRLDGPTEISVGWSEERGSEGGALQRQRVDPATTALVEFDLAAKETRPVVVELPREGRVALPERALLVLVAVASSGELALDVRALVELRGAKGRHPIALAAGRWLWFVVGDVRGVIAGVADVEPFAVGVPITLQADLEERAAVEIGRGFTVESIAGVEIAAKLRESLQWLAVGKPASDAPIVVPSGARIALREE
ncbi:MAG: RNA polymerase sigma factor [Planctomycetes bacterium]|nr:RNA polymerase sigma factor [Planctomycetota bacterium]